MPNSETLDIIVRMKDQAGKNLKNLNKGLKNTEKTAKKASRALAGFGRGIKSVGKAMFSLKSAIAGVGITLLARNLIQASNEQAKAVEGLNAALIAMGRYTPELSTKLQDVATGLQGLTNYGDEATIEGQKFLVTYRNITDDLLPRTSKVMVDLAALMGGDVAQAANLLGKASLGMVGSLKRVGVDVSQSTFDLEGYAGVLAQIETQVSGQAEAQRKATGSLIAMGNSFGDLKEKAGDVLKLALEPIAKVLLTMFDNWNDSIAKLQKEGNLSSWASRISKTIIDALSKVVKIVALISDSFNGWRMIWQGLTIAFSYFAQALNKGLSLYLKGWELIFTAIGKGIEGVATAVDKVDVFGKFEEQTKSAKEFGKSMQELDVSDQLESNAKWWSEVREESQAELDVLASKKSNYQKVLPLLDKMREKALAYTAELRDFKKIEPPEQPDVRIPLEASAEAQAKSALSKLNSVTQVVLAKQKQLFEEGQINVQQYYDKQLVLLEDVHTKELEMLRAQRKKAEGEQDEGKRVDKILAINDKIFAAEQKHILNVHNLKLKQAKDEEVIEEKKASLKQAFAELEARTVDTTDVRAQHQVALDELKTAHQLELQEIDKFTDDVAVLEDAKRLQTLEKDKILAEQRLEIQRLYVENFKSTLGDIGSAFGDLYEATGQKTKAFFKAQQAASVVQTLISTYEGAQKAYTAMASINPVLGAAAAAAALVAGLARVAKIKAQSLALGGVVGGYSPSPTADNIPINATAGEYMQPVAPTKYYGLRGMEAIKNMLVPREVIASYAKGVNIPTFKVQRNYADGGSVTSPKMDQSAGQQPVTVANFIDPALFAEFIATDQGQDLVFNVMSSRAGQYKQVLTQE